jgi:hypothetical protein
LQASVIAVAIDAHANGLAGPHSSSRLKGESACRGRPSGLLVEASRLGGLCQQLKMVIVRIVFSSPLGDHDAWRGRPGTVRFSGCSRGASCISKAAGRLPFARPETIPINNH